MFGFRYTKIEWNKWASQNYPTKQNEMTLKGRNRTMRNEGGWAKYYKQPPIRNKTWDAQRKCADMCNIHLEPALSQLGPAMELSTIGCSNTQNTLQVIQKTISPRPSWSRPCMHLSINVDRMWVCFWHF